VLPAQESTTRAQAITVMARLLRLLEGGSSHKGGREGHFLPRGIPPGACHRCHRFVKAQEVCRAQLPELWRTYLVRLVKLLLPLCLPSSCWWPR
jgi:hypothetical protein